MLNAISIKNYRIETITHSRLSYQRSIFSDIYLYFIYRSLQNEVLIYTGRNVSRRRVYAQQIYKTHFNIVRDICSFNSFRFSTIVEEIVRVGSPCPGARFLCPDRCECHVNVLINQGYRLLDQEHLRSWDLRQAQVSFDTPRAQLQLAGKKPADRQYVRPHVGAGDNTIVPG